MSSHSHSLCTPTPTSKSPQKMSSPNTETYIKLHVVPLTRQTNIALKFLHTVSVSVNTLMTEFNLAEYNSVWGIFWVTGWCQHVALTSPEIPTPTPVHPYSVYHVLNHLVIGQGGNTGKWNPHNKKSGNQCMELQCMQCAIKRSCPIQNIQQLG